MNRTLSVLAVAAAALLAAPPLATAAPQQDRVTGKGAIGPDEVRINATSGPQGENPRGTFTVNFSGSTAYHVKVSCMIVSGDTAIVGGLDSKGNEVFVIVQDNGDSGDLATNSFGGPRDTEPNQERCALILSSVSPFPATGDFTVVDN
jgi:hypothetical protein